MDVNSKQNRQSNIELLRIFATLFVIAHHFAIYSGFEFYSKAISFNKLWIQFIKMSGGIGIDVFVLISGYFLISKKEVNTNKIVKLWTQIFFYSTFIYIAFVFFKAVPFEIKELVKNLLPISFSKWWFASTYFLLYLLSPYINSMIKALDKKWFIEFLLIFGLLWCVIPTFTGILFQSNNLIWFAYLYCLGAYIRLYNPIVNKSMKSFFLILIMIITAISILLIVLDYCEFLISDFEIGNYFLFSKQSFSVLIISVLLLICFSKSQIKYTRIINCIASNTFGVYLIHENEYVRSLLWQNVFKGIKYTESFALVPYSIFATIIVFICCSVLETTRKQMFAIIEEFVSRIANGSYK